MSEFDSKKIHTSPVGVSVWPKLVEPEVKFNPEGVFTVRLRFNEADEAAMVEQLTSLYDQAYAENCKTEKKAKLKKADFPWKAEVTKDEEGIETETGHLLFTYKMAASGKNKQGKPYTQKPGIFDGQGASMNGIDGLNIGGGSEMRVAFSVRAFYTAVIGSGISLKLKSAQITKLVSYGERSASDYGFGAVEGAYSSKPVESSADTDAPAAAEGDADSDF